MFKCQFLESHSILEPVDVCFKLRYRIPRQVQGEHQPAKFVINEAGHCPNFQRVSVYDSVFQQIVIRMSVMPKNKLINKC